jgi:5-methylcytosine-specific restriction endonuclease McrA
VSALVHEASTAPLATAPAGTVKLSAEIRRWLRDLVAERDGWTCFYCCRPVVAPPRGRAYTPAEAPDVATLDHWLPAARGGSWELANLVLSCGRCNEDKHALTGPEYLAVLAYRRAHPTGRDRLSALPLVRSPIRWDRSPDRWWSPIAWLARRARRTGTTGRTAVRRVGRTVRPAPGAVRPTFLGTGPETSTRTASETADETVSETGRPLRDRARHKLSAQHVTTGHGPAESRGATTTDGHTLAGFPPGNLPHPDDTPGTARTQLHVVTGGPLRGPWGAGGGRSSRSAREETGR